MADNDVYTETTTQGWLSRIKGALMGLIFGPLLILGSVILLWWNEGRTIRTATALNEGKNEVIAAPSETVNQANEGKLIYLRGLATTKENLEDKEFGVEQNALKLRRRVEMYQWVEKTDSTSSKNLGGSETTKTTYTYSKEWSERPIESNKFKQQQGHTNPEKFPFLSESWTASNATVGAYQLSQSLVNKIGDEQKFKITEAATDEDDEPIGTLFDGGYFMGKDPKNPEVGDMRVSFYFVAPQEISLVAGQAGNTLAPFTTKNGTVIGLVQSGTHTSDELFADAQSENTIIAWLLRLVGLVLSMAGFGAIMKPLSVLADVVPLIGSIVGFGTGFISMILGIVVSGLTIAVAWVAYRPLLAAGIIIAMIGLVVYMFKRKKLQPVPVAQPAAP